MKNNTIHTHNPAECVYPPEVTTEQFSVWMSKKMKTARDQFQAKSNRF